MTEFSSYRVPVPERKRRGWKSFRQVCSEPSLPSALLKDK